MPAGGRADKMDRWDAQERGNGDSKYYIIKSVSYGKVFHCNSIFGRCVVI
jgi:hypothetical protein